MGTQNIPEGDCVSLISNDFYQGGDKSKKSLRLKLQIAELESENKRTKCYNKKAFVDHVCHVNDEETITITKKTFLEIYNSLSFNQVKRELSAKNLNMPDYMKYAKANKAEAVDILKLLLVKEGDAAVEENSVTTAHAVVKPQVDQPESKILINNGEAESKDSAYNNE